MKLKTDYTTIGLALASVLALTACDNGAPPGPDPIATPAEEPVSIIREDIEVPREEAPMTRLELRIPFAESADELSAAARSELATALASPQMEAGGEIILGGHSDAGGNDAVNLRVSEQRAETVRDFLIEQGVAPERIRVIAFGEQNPVEPNAMPDGTPNEAGRAANRRVELTILVPEGTPEAQPVDEPQGATENLVG